MILGVSKSRSDNPNYFDVVANTSDTALFTIISGGGITAIGWFTPFIVLGSVLATVGNGLIYTFDIHSSSSVWIGYQVLAGAGLG